MNVLIFGSSQVRHIDKIYKNAGHYVLHVVPSTGNPFLKAVNLFKIMRAGLIYCVGGVDVKTHPYLRVGKCLGKRIVVHWIGTDVLMATKKYEETGEIINQDCVNICGSNLLRKELHDIGIESEVIPIVPVDIKFEPLAPAKEHAVLAYIPQTREEFYNYPLLKEVAKAFPELPFYVVANDGANEPEKPPNIHFLGRIPPDEMRIVYQKTSILFRYPEHDGLSMMVLEALGLGRRVIYKYKLPYVVTPKSDALSDIIDSFHAILVSPPSVNEDAVNYVNTNFSLEKQTLLYENARVI